MKRRFTAITLASLLATGTVGAQDAAPADSGTSTDIAPPSNNAPSSSFAPSTGPNEASPLPSESGALTPGGNQALSAGVVSGAAPVAPPSSFDLPGGNGFLPTTATAGQGRFAQPRFRVTVSLSQGYNDNVYDTPSHPIVPQKKIGSAVTNGRIAFQTQAITPRSVFTLDASGGVLYYWDRPGRATDYEGDVGLSFAHRINPRMNVSAQGNAVFSSEPDFSRINTPSGRSVTDEYFSANTKLDLTYGWTRRFSTDSSYFFNTTVPINQNNTGQVGINKYYENGLGTEFRYTVSPRSTAVLDFRETLDTHPDDSQQDSNSTFLLAGFDYAASNRIHATLRVGDQIRNFSEGDTENTPYVETTASYLFSRGSVIWTNRYGFEEAGSAFESATQSRLTYRTSLGLTYAFGARLTSNVGVAYNYNTVSTVSGPSQPDITEQQLQVNAGLTYVVTSHLAFNLNYTLTKLFSNQQGQDYLTNQIFLGASYSF